MLEIISAYSTIIRKVYIFVHINVANVVMEVGSFQAIIRRIMHEFAPELYYSLAGRNQHVEL